MNAKSQLYLEWRISFQITAIKNRGEAEGCWSGWWMKKVLFRHRLRRVYLRMSFVVAGPRSALIRSNRWSEMNSGSGIYTGIDSESVESDNYKKPSDSFGVIVVVSAKETRTWIRCWRKNVRSTFEEQNWKCQDVILWRLTIWNNRVEYFANFLLFHPTKYTTHF